MKDFLIRFPHCQLTTSAKLLDFMQRRKHGILFSETDEVYENEAYMTAMPAPSETIDS